MPGKPKKVRLEHGRRVAIGPGLGAMAAQHNYFLRMIDSRRKRFGRPLLAVPILDLVRSGKAYVKISGAYRASNLAPDYADVIPLARALITANSDRIIWGSDWPHPDSVTPPGKKPTDVTPLLQIDDGRLLNQLPVWAPDAATRKRILVDNPARLYGF